jgi:hypothetical protein
MACDYLAIYNALLVGVAIAAGPLWNAFHNCPIATQTPATPTPPTCDFLTPSYIPSSEWLLRHCDASSEQIPQDSRFPPPFYLPPQIVRHLAHKHTRNAG